VGGALVLLRGGTPGLVSRTTLALLGAGLVAALFWAELRAVYTALGAPDVLLGGPGAERLLEAPRLGLADPRGSAWLQALMLAGALSSFLASTVALRERLGALDPSGGGEIGHDWGLWGGIFAGAAVASLWRVDPWMLTLLALGGAASALAPATLWPPPPERRLAATAAGLLGIGVFLALAIWGGLRAPLEGPAAAVAAHPALVALPAGAAVLWIAGRSARR
jgi:hypothetical protein